MAIDRASRRRFVAGMAASVAGGMPTGSWAQTLGAAAPLPTAAGAVPVRKNASTTRLSGSAHPKFVEPLPNPLAAVNQFVPTGVSGGQPLYTLRLTELSTAIGLVATNGTRLQTTLWGYGTPAQAATSPGRTFVVQSNQPVRVRYENRLLAPDGSAAAHRLPVDTTLMWANPGNLGGSAPVPAVQHRHGGLQESLSDGLPDAWATPQNGYVGRLFNGEFLYGNDQEAAHLWYHDHALGVTRLNVFMGLAGHYFIRDANEAALRSANRLPSTEHEIALVIQDRMFTADGQLFYPSTAKKPATAPAVSHVPEFFGDFILVNGVPWPQAAVEPRPYRLRLLNGSDSRFFDLQFQPDRGGPVPLFQIGTDLGLMNAPVPLTHLLLAPGERADVIIDFSAFAGRQVLVGNSAATPFPLGTRVDNATAAKVMQFRVSLPLNAAQPRATLATSLRPVHGPLPALSTAGVPVRKLLLLEGLDPFGRLQTMLGTVDPSLNNPLGDPRAALSGTFLYNEPVTEVMRQGTTEVWEFHNTTVDAHPIHLHLVDFRVVERQPFTGTVVPKPMGANGGGTGGWLTNVVTAGPARPHEPNEAGRKDTVIAYPGEITRILVSFPRAGEYVWHCHILSHEDHEMMRRFVVV